MELHKVIGVRGPIPGVGLWSSSERSDWTWKSREENKQRVFKNKNNNNNKTFNKFSVEGMHLNIIKAIYNKHTVNIILHGENMKAFPLKSWKIQQCPISPPLFNIILEF